MQSPIQTKESTNNAKTLFKSYDKEDQGEENIIVLENIQKTYLLGIEGVPALRGVSLKIKRGEYVAIYGTSGGGKTSLLNIIGTIDKPTKGHLTICGKRITSRTSDEDLATIRLKRMGFVFQTFNLLSTMTAIENVEMPMILKGTLSKSARRKRAKELLEKVGMGPRLSHVPSQLSGGEQQRVTIARAIANEPDILLLDEPTGDLDTKNTLIVMQMLMKLNEEDGITCVMVTHDPNLKYVADRVFYMRDGKLDRIEVNPRELKREFKEKIAAELNGISGPLVDRNARFTQITEFRKPKSYETYDTSAVVMAETLLLEHDARKELPLHMRQQQQPQQPSNDLYIAVHTNNNGIMEQQQVPMVSQKEYETMLFANQLHQQIPTKQDGIRVQESNLIISDFNNLESSSSSERH